MRLPDLSIAIKNKMVTRVVGIFWIIAKIISCKVWLADRIFPVVPPFNFLFVSSIVHTILFIVSLIALSLLVLFPSKRIIWVLVIIVELGSCILDQNRWQPWEFEYIFILIVYMINSKSEKNAASMIAFIFISIYFFSGISKMNYSFSQNLRYEIMRSGSFHEVRSIVFTWFLFHSGYLLGLIETLLGIGLFFRFSQKTSAVFLIFMHLLILAAVGPLGIDYDIIVWPWNMAMIFILYIFFIRSTPISFSFRELTFGWNKFILILFGVLPVLNFFGYWDYFLSASLFSSRPPGMYVCIHNRDSNNELKSFYSENKNQIICDSNSALIDVTKWSFEEMQVPVYPEIRIFKNIKEQLLKRYPEMDATFIVSYYVNGRREKMELK